MLADAALVLMARMQLAELADALTFDLADDGAAAALRRWLEVARPEALAAPRRLP
jgi:hypothetical protein